MNDLEDCRIASLVRISRRKGLILFNCFKLHHKLLWDYEENNYETDVVRNRLFACWHHERGYYGCTYFKRERYMPRLCSVCNNLIYFGMRDDYFKGRRHFNDCIDCGLYCL